MGNGTLHSIFCLLWVYWKKMNFLNLKKILLSHHTILHSILKRTSCQEILNVVLFPVEHAPIQASLSERERDTIRTIHSKRKSPSPPNSTRATNEAFNYRCNIMRSRINPWQYAQDSLVDVRRQIVVMALQIVWWEWLWWSAFLGSHLNEINDNDQYLYRNSLVCGDECDARHIWNQYHLSSTTTNNSTSYVWSVKKSIFSGRFTTWHIFNNKMNVFWVIGANCVQLRKRLMAWAKYYYNCVGSTMSWFHELDPQNILSPLASRQTYAASFTNIRERWPQNLQSIINRSITIIN